MKQFVNPSALAVALYALDAIFVVWLLPPTRAGAGFRSSTNDEEKTKMKEHPGFFASLKRSFGNASVGKYILLRACFMLVSGAARSLQDVWEMERFSLGAGQLGRLRTGKSLLGMAVQGLLAGRAVRVLGERSAFRAGAALFIAGYVSEYYTEDLWAYTYLAMPLQTVAAILASLSLESLMTKVVPSTELGTALALIDVLGSAVGVVAPLLAGIVTQYYGILFKTNAAIFGYLGLFFLALVAIPGSAAQLDSKNSIKLA